MSQIEYLSKEFVRQLMQEHTPQKRIVVLSIQPFNIDNSASILAVLTAGRTTRMLGHFGLKVTYKEDEKQHSRNMVMKIKPHGTEIVEMLSSLAQACGEPLATVYPDFKTKTGFQQTHKREQEIYKKLAPSFTPEIFGLHTDDAEQVYVVLMEYLENVELLNSVMQPELWTNAHIEEALTQMAVWHATMLHITPAIDMTLWEDAPSLDYMKSLQPLWQALLENAAKNFPSLYSDSRTQLLQTAINNISSRWKLIAHLPKTLIHNDCNPRNSCFKIVDGKIRFCLYDWELSTFHIPQYDLVEFLCFILDEDTYNKRAYYIEFYRQQLSNKTGRYTDVTAFNKELVLAAYDFGLHRVGMYMMAHSLSPYPFMPRVVNSFFDTVEQEDYTDV